MSTKKLEYIVVEESELKPIADALIDFAGDVKVWAFKGEMGAGKTTFIREISKILEVQENVSSPTFSIVNEYSRKNGELVYHFDFYRINSIKEATDIGCEEYFYSGAICMIEWPEKILNLLPEPRIQIELSIQGSQRTITFSHE